MFFNLLTVSDFPRELFSTFAAASTEFPVEKLDVCYDVNEALVNPDWVTPVYFVVVPSPPVRYVNGRRTRRPAR